MCYVACVVVSSAAQTRVSPTPVADRRATPAPAARTRYRIRLALDFDARTFTGTERVRWLNRDDHPTNALYFHLYANTRGTLPSTPPRTPAASPAQDAAAEADEPRVEVSQVRAAATGAALQFALDDQATVLRVNLREAVAPGGAAEIEIDFKGTVPEIDPDETSLPSHVIQQLGAAVRDTREVRHARDTNFLSRGVMLLGACYPVLAVRQGSEWQRDARATVGDWLYEEVADYDVTVNAPRDIGLFTSAESRAEPAPSADSATANAAERSFAGESLRNFALVAGRGLQAAEQQVEGVRVRSIFWREHEKTGRRVLDVAAKAARIFNARFGALPGRTLSVAEVPLVAGLGSAEFAGLSVIASAFYVDFDSPAVRNLPEIVREQRTSVEDSLEFAVAHMVAHQWWGVTVGSDPERQPVLDEALAHWSALVYYRETYGAERADEASADQLRGVYEIYRTFGGEDMTADRAARDYHNSFQYAAIVAAKGALMFGALEKLLGEERVFTALRRYYEANRSEIAESNDLVGAFIAESPVEQRRAVARTFDRWLSERHGDEDIAQPNQQLAAALGVSVEQGSRDGGNRFSRLGKFFWRQMTRIR
ncbi:MAG: M1 family aminopeptidase [Pyrinomonadaceae bacterium]